MPADYFMLTFTLPAEFRPLAWAHPNVVYELLLRCSWETVRTFSHNDKQLQGTPGAIAMLHTNTRQMEFHPHVHLVMPAAAVDGKRRGYPQPDRELAERQSKRSGKPLLRIPDATMYFGNGASLRPEQAANANGQRGDAHAEA